MLARIVGRGDRHAALQRMMQLCRSTYAADTAAKVDVPLQPGVKNDYIMPAEWKQQQQVWMGWPQRPYVWRDNAVPAQRAWVQVTTAISQFEPVTVCANEEQVENARQMLPESDNISVVSLTQDDTWFRDTGPIFTVRRAEGGHNTGILGIDFRRVPFKTEYSRTASAHCGYTTSIRADHLRFNGYGGITRNPKLDDAVAAEVLKRAGVAAVRSSLVLEGGSIHTDGEGTLLTTESCLLSKTRNPRLRRADIEAELRRHLGVSKFIWLPTGLKPDVDTDGHVDNVACFVAPGKVLLAWTDDRTDPQFQGLQAAYDVLTSVTDARGRGIEVVKLPLPPPLHVTEESAGLAPEPRPPHWDPRKKHPVPRAPGMQLAASYVNFLICNGGIVAPALNVPESDDRAKRVLQGAFPDREVVMIPDSREILLGGGNIHCITCQQPAVPSPQPV